MDNDKIILSDKQEFRNVIFAKTNSKCCVPGCNCYAYDAFHILGYHLWGNEGAYKISNGVALCSLHYRALVRGTIMPADCVKFMNIDPNNIDCPPKLINEYESDEEFRTLLMSGQIDCNGKRRIKYLTRVCVECTEPYKKEIPWHKPDEIPSKEELEKEKNALTVLYKFKIYFTNYKEGGYIDLSECSKEVHLSECDGWLCGYQSTHIMRMRDDIVDDAPVLRWYHEFYQDDPSDNSHDFYHRQREAIAVLEAEKQIKNGLYLTRVVSIEPCGEFRIMGVAGGCFHQYYIGEEFYLRKHKKSKCDWFDSRTPDRDYTEDFRLIPKKEEDV